MDRNKRDRGDMLFQYDNTNTTTALNWMDRRPFLLLWSIKNMGDSFHTVSRKVKDSSGKFTTIIVNRPNVVEYYTKYMRGIDVA